MSRRALGFGERPDGGLPAPFGPLDAPEFVGAVRAARATVIEAPAAGLDRLFAAAEAPATKRAEPPRAV